MGLPQSLFSPPELPRPLLLLFSLLSMLDYCIIKLFGASETSEFETLPPVDDVLRNIELTNFVPLLGEADACSICLCDFRGRDKIGIPPNCRHTFHKDCLCKWVNAHNNSCPLCRSPVF
ncbi:hypothetical protein AMTRI_Chr09g36450 [Amborella trichopoda]